MRWGISFPVGLGLPRLFLDLEIEIPDPPQRPAPEEPEMTSPNPRRPEPLRESAVTVSKVWGLLAAIIGGTGMFGLLNAAQTDAVLALGDQLAPTWMIILTLWGTLGPLVANLIGAFRTARKARDEVTPIADPAAWDEEGERLVKLVPVYRTGRHARPEPTL